MSLNVEEQISEGTIPFGRWRANGRNSDGSFLKKRPTWLGGYCIGATGQSLTVMTN